MKAADLAKQTAKTINIHSPAILMGLGVAGVITTGVFAARAGYRAAQRLESQSPDLTTLEKAKIVWPVYIPAAAMGAVTIAAIMTSQHISARRSAAIMSLYTVTDKAFSEYKEKIVETFGEAKEEKVRADIAQARLERDPVTDNTVIINASGGEVLCYDEHTGRYFDSDMDTIRGAQNDLNALIISQNYASLNDWYRLIGLAPIPTGEEIGWNTGRLLDIQYSAHITPNNRPTLSLAFRTEPLAGYYKGFY